MQKAWKIFLNSIPVLLMVGLIPLITNDYALALVYVGIIAVALGVKRSKNDLVLLAFGFCSMILFEAIFISTGVETFVRRSLFGLMPVWLPVLWAYGFVAIKRGVEILGAE